MLHLGIFLAATGASRTDSLNVNIPKEQRAVGGGRWEVMDRDNGVKPKDLGAFRQTVLVRLYSRKYRVYNEDILSV